MYIKMRMWLVGLAVVAAGCGQSGSGAWTPPVRIDGGMPGDDLMLSGSEAGTAFAMWTHWGPQLTDTVWVNVYSPSRGWEGAQIVAEGRALQVIAAADGEAFAIWGNAGMLVTNLYQSRYRPGSGWTEPVVIPQAKSAQWAVAANGRALLAWTSADSIYVQDFDDQRGLGAPQKIGSLVPLFGVDAGIGVVRALVDSKGDALVIWSQDYTSPPRTMYGYYRGAWRIGAEAWRSEQDLLQLNGLPEGDDEGRALAVWYDATTKSVRYARFSPAEGWQPPRDVGVPPPFVPANLAMDRTGRGVLLLTDNHQRLASVAYAPEAGWGATDVTGDAEVGPNRYDARVVTGPLGRGLAVWAQASAGHAASVWAALVTPWAGRELVTPDNENRPGRCPGDIATVGAGGLVTAMAGPANTVVAWVDLDCEGSRILSSVRAATR